MKNTFTTAALLFSMTTFAQVGINNTSPKATLDITAKTSGTKPEGLIIPQLSGDQIRTATAGAVYGTNQKGLIVYASSADTNPTGATANITAAGYYYFDGGAWQRILETSSGDTTNDAWVNDTTNSVVKLGTKANGTARTTGTDVVVKDDGKVGIGTATPGSLLDLVADNKGTAGQDDISLSSYNSTGTPSAGLIFNVARGTAAASANLQNNDLLASIISYGRIGGNTINTSNIITRYKGDGTTNLSSMTLNTSGADRMLIDENGRVGIGTTAPKSYLNVNTPTAGGTIDAGIFSINNCGSSCTQNTARNIVLNNSNVTNTTFASLDFVPSTDPTSPSGASIQGIDRDATNNYAGLSFFTRNATDYNSRMVIKSSGNVGIANSNPQATLDVSAISGGSKPEGLIAPRLSLAALQLYTYTSAQTGAIVYVNSASGTPAGQTANVTAVGYYYFDGSAWQKIMAGTIANADLSTGVGGIYKGSGSLSGNTTVTQGASTLAFTSTATNGFSVDGNTLSVDAANNRVGIGTATPASRLVLENDNNTDDYDDFMINTYSTTATPSILLTQSRGTKATPANLQNGDIMGGVNFRGRANGTSNTMSTINSIYRGNGTTSLSDLNFSTSGTTKMRIDENGNVGIGTSTPSAKLHTVSGTAYGAFQIQDGSEGTGKFLSSNATGQATWVNSPLTPVAFGTLNTGSITISGNKYLNSSVTLTQGKWLVYVGLLLTTTGTATNTDNTWVRLTLGSNNSGTGATQSGFSFLASSLVSGWLSTVNAASGSTSKWTFINGVIPVNVTSSSQTIYLWTREIGVTGTDPGVTIGNNGENYLFAVPAY